MGAVIIKQIKEFYRDGTMIFVCVFFPVALVFILGQLLGGMMNISDATIGEIKIGYYSQMTEIENGAFEQFILSLEEEGAVLAQGFNNMVGIALLIAMCFKSLASMSTATIGFSSVGCIIGGAWFPVNDSLGFISNCAKLFPQYWFMNAIRNGKSEEWFDEVAALPNSGGMSIVILVLFMLLVYLISAVIFARKSD